jgi:predicted nucleotidyltransferase
MQRQRIIELAARRGASNVRVFGSVARGDSNESSDYDFLVDLAPDRSLMDLGGLLMDLQELLRARVDITTESMLRPGVRENALRDAVPL